MRAAVIDLGTNTSNLIVAEIPSAEVNIIYQGKEYVRLGDKNISDNNISEAAMERAVAALDRQVRHAKTLNATTIRILATSAVRHASNRQVIAQRILQKTGIEIEIISGDREAELIYRGVKLALGTLESPAAILDIGGGSNEIIICQNGSVLWQESFAAGMTRIIHHFPISNPIRSNEVELLAEHFAVVHSAAFEACRQYEVNTLIGCSGAFSTLSDVLEGVDPELFFRRSKEIPISDFSRVYGMMLKSTTEERSQMKGMDAMRTDLIVPALILGRTLLDQTGINKIVHTGYALREGVLYEMINSLTSLQPLVGTSSADREN